MTDAFDADQDRGSAPDAVVTGAAGWLGRNLVPALVGSRARIRCLVRSDDEAPLLELLDPRVEVIVGDVRDPVALDKLFDDLSGATVFHAAAVIHPDGRTREVFDVNVGGTELALDRARRAGARRFLHVSSNSPFGANPTPWDRFDEDSPYNPYLGYGQSKMEAELLVKQSHERGDVPAVILRAPWFYGPEQPARQTQFLSAVRRGRFPLVGDGTQQRSMVFTGNLVHGLLLAENAAAAPGRAYWIADAEPYALRTIFDTVRDALAAEGLDVTRRQPRIPRAAAELAARLDGILQARGRYQQALHVLGELKDTIACDITRARSELAYDPPVALLEGMRRSVRFALDHGERL
ncbi:MAG: NAD(P)-dependent oxidoreductase [Actinobacteria bacterium]|nr:NAD(P)-dependent oxidoreductase [Actinomycetota bacterium]